MVQWSREVDKLHALPVQSPYLEHLPTPDGECTGTSHHSRALMDNDTRRSAKERFTQDLAIMEARSEPCQVTADPTGDHKAITVRHVNSTGSGEYANKAGCADMTIAVASVGPASRFLLLLAPMSESKRLVEALHGKGCPGPTKGKRHYQMRVVSAPPGCFYT